MFLEDFLTLNIDLNIRLLSDSDERNNIEKCMLFNFHLKFIIAGSG